MSYPSEKLTLWSLLGGVSSRDARRTEPLLPALVGHVLPHFGTSASIIDVVEMGRVDLVVWIVCLYRPLDARRRVSTFSHSGIHRLRPSTYKATSTTISVLYSAEEATLSGTGSVPGDREPCVPVWFSGLTGFDAHMTSVVAR